MGKNLPEKELTPTEFFLNLMSADDPDRILSKKNVAKYKDAKDEEQDEIGRDALMALGVENGYALYSTIYDAHHRRIALKARRELIRQFKCENVAERMLVDNIIASYIQFLTASNALSRNLHREEVPIDGSWNEYRSSLNKQIDTANRRFITSYQILLQLKQPRINVNVKTKNAFVAQAQQFNSNDAK